MSDESKPNQGDDTQDPVKNLKAEYDRKLGNLDATTAQLVEQNKALMAMLNKPAAQPTAAKKSIKELWYQDEEGAANAIVDEAEARITRKIEESNRVQAKQNQVIAELYKDFPEVGTPGSDLQNKALEIYNSMPAEDRANPLAYKVAVKDAAMELGLKPKSKRGAAQNADDFSLGGASSQPKPGRQKDGEIPQEVLQIAQMMGRDISDPKVIEGLKSASKRSKWGKYQG